MRERLNRGGVAVDYQVARSNETWADHRLRTLVTGATIAWLRPESVMDPACGDASIVQAALRDTAIRKVYLADISQPNIERIVMPDATTRCDDIASAMTFFPAVDVVVLTEILEHLDDPTAIARLAKAKGRYLIASSPEMRPGQIDGNPEHLWQFDEHGYREMLVEAGWEPVQHTTLRFQSEYDFGVWVCR